MLLFLQCVNYKEREQTAELVFVFGRKASNGPELWSGLPCKPNQEPENKRPKIEQRTTILSMSRVVQVKIIQWENIIKGLSTPYPHLTPFKSNKVTERGRRWISHIVCNTISRKWLRMDS